MSAGIQVQTFGNFGLSISEKAVILPLVSAQKLVALLCQRPEYQWPRSEIGRLLWPDSDDGASRNRLRTALVYARAAIGQAAEFKGDKQSLWLETATLKVDLWEARATLRRARGAADDQQEEQMLRQLLEIVHAPYLVAFDDDWAQDERRQWKDHAVEARLRLGEIAESREDWQAGILAIEPVLKDAPYDERAWAALLRLSSRQGRHVEMCDRWASARVRLRKEVAGRFSPSLVRLAESVRTGGRYPTQLHPAEGDMASRTLGRMMSDSPEEALKFLGSPAFRIEVIRSPQIAGDLLDRALDATRGFNEERLQCAAFALMAHGFLHQQQRIRELAPLILEHDQDLGRRKGAATVLSFAHFQSRDWEKAYASAELALELAMSLGNSVGIHLAHSQLAAFDLHMGKFEQALATYRTSLEALAKSNELQALLGRTVITANVGFIHFYQGEYRQADIWFQRGISMAAIADHPTLLALALPAHGAVNLALGATEVGIEKVSRGLGLAYRQKDSRSLEIALDCSALALAHLDRGSQSQAVVARVTEMRALSGHSRSIAEELLVTQIGERNQLAIPDADWMALPTHRQLVMEVLDTLMQFTSRAS